MNSILNAIQPVRHISLKSWREDFGIEIAEDTPAHRLLRDGDAWVVLFRSGVICFFGAGPGLRMASGSKTRLMARWMLRLSGLSSRGT